MSIPGSASPLFIGAAADAAAFKIDRSLRFNDGDSAYLNRTPSLAGNRKTYSLSFWAKKSKNDDEMFIFAAKGGTGRDGFRFEPGNTFRVFFDSANDGDLVTSQVFRDPSAWYHFVIAVDTTQSTAANRVKIYVNGTQITDFSTETYPAQNYTSEVNNTDVHRLGADTNNLSNTLEGYLTEFHFIDGQQLAASDFGEYDSNNVWQPKNTSGLTFGTNGFRLKFDDNSSAAALGNDSSGNDNDWTVNNLSVASGAGNDSLIDTPSNYTASSGNNGGNYATLNPLDFSSSGSPTLTNGNLDAVSSNGWQTVAATIGNFTSGKWYWEVKLGGASGHRTGLSSVARSEASETDLLGSGDIAVNSSDGRVYVDGTEVGTGAGSLSGKTVGIALNLDANSVSFYQNGSLIHTVSSLSSTASWTPVHAVRYSTVDNLNFGQRPFAYTPPSNHLPLVTTNLPDPTIADGSTAMDAITYTGNGSSKTISGVGFTSDLIWTKCRNQARSHYLVDTVRGISKYLVAEQSSQEGTNTTNRILSLTSDGWTLGTNNAFNGNNDTYVAWAWDGGTSTVSNTDGGRTTNVRANATVGFSIVTFNDGNSANTYGHGLNAAPEFIIVKTRDTSANWFVYHSALGATKYIQLNKTGGANSSANHFNNTAPTSSVFSLGSDISFDADQVAFCWTPVEGFSSFGSYTGNGNADGPFIFTGFRPAFILLKRTDTTGFNWILSDTTRDPSNEAENLLRPNLSNEEVSQFLDQDILSNGFKHRGTDGASNASGGTYIYMAFAEHPFKTARAR